jgi:phage-related protein
MDNQVFQLVVLEEAGRFLKTLSPSVRKKIAYNIDKIQGGIKDAEVFKKLENSEIWEFRTLYGGIAYRLFAFWDTRTDTLVVATNGIIKKTQKTPSKEIAKAEEIRRRYFETKK